MKKKIDTISADLYEWTCKICKHINVNSNSGYVVCEQCGFKYLLV